MTDDTDARRRDDLERELERSLADAEDTVALLRRELASRRTHRLQHAEIDRLAEHLANSRVRWHEVRVFFEEAFREVAHDGSEAGDGSGSDAGRHPGHA
ncbi:hypothetical protein G4H71_13260 [Rhodococcus triatomae]|uniref:Uncharacterized protein n=1 Tax=Rhodococcus triatomae TaxID=300028 RepID=A0A1G8H2Y5_9NOCA|nr:hypothetical protein [Rhodococcus triatomae]QNG20222.1 hypothetical protein G4H72_17120 [Rhodococcus triatomae]QNG23863.1 hypothetical protein G4H71_13260 [Rhodococcus triatomae]SDI01018.1 hypothetical protein SAMN05444695_104295 [Rhodococcus triatomae]